MPDFLNKIIYLTQQQYDTLASGGTVSGQTGLNNNYIYMTDSVFGSSILPITSGGTGASTAATARTNLGLGTMATETAANYLTTTNNDSRYYKLDGSNTGATLKISANSTAVTEAIAFMSNDNIVAKIGCSTAGKVAIYTSALVLRPSLTNTSLGVELSTTALYPTTAITLGTSSNKWSTIYATTFDGNATSASTLDYTLATTTKAYLMASSDAPTSTTIARAAKGDTGVYLTTTAGELSAVKYSINASGTEKVRLEYNSTDESLDFVFI